MTGKKLKAIFLLLILATVVFLAEGNVFAKNPEFRLDIDSLNLQKGTSTNLVLSMVNAQGAEVIDIKGLENFDVLSSNQSTSTRIINGDISYQHNISYIVMPKNVGEFTLKGSVKYNGSTYETNELKVNIGEASKVEEGEVENLFIKTIISNDEIYLGQKVILAYELYSRYNIENFGFLDSVNIDGFMLSDVPQDKLTASYVYLEGNKYVKYEAKQMYLSPIKPGTYTIPEYNFQVNVSTGDFFSSSKPFYLKTKSKELTVKPLPMENRPLDFSGIVGKLNVESSFSKQEVSYGDSLTLRVTASGSCNLEALEKIIKDGIPGFTVYETEKGMEESVENNQYKARKEFEVILVPEKNGDISIDPIHISYFDPESGSYDKAEIPGTTITVKGDAPKVQTLQQSESAAVEKVKIDQISYNTQNKGYVTIQFKKDHLLIGLAVVVFLIVVSALVFFMLMYRRKYDSNLQSMYKKLRSTDNKNDIYNILNNMIKYRFNLSLKASSRDRIINCLAQYKLDGPVLEVMDYMENKKDYSDKDWMYLKGKIKEIYKAIQEGQI